MGNSRKSPNPADDPALQGAFERALGDILARVFVGTIVGAQASPALAVAYSGGLDSSVLLHLAARHAARRGLPLYAFHIHHGLSPDADAWERHCRDQALRYGAVFDARRVQVGREQGGGVEEAARIARYAALGDLCRAHHVELLLTAHHQDDQAETVLLQLLRGAGLPGLSGMASCSPRHALLGEGVALGRPLLEMSRAQLESALSAAGLAHVVDASNSDVRYRRNALRHGIAPLLAGHFPGFPALVARTAAHAQSAQSLLLELAEIDLAACRTDGSGASLALEALRRLSRTRCENLLRYWLSSHGVRMPSTARLDELRAQALDTEGSAHPMLDFGALVAYRSGNRLELHPRLGQAPDAPLALHWRGESEIAVPAWRGRLVIETANGPGLDPARLREGPLTLRSRAGQERLKLAGNRPSHSLKNLFQEACVPAWRREWMPLLYLGKDLVFVAGLGMDARCLTMPQGLTLCWEGPL